MRQAGLVYDRKFYIIAVSNLDYPVNNFGISRYLQNISRRVVNVVLINSSSSNISKNS